MDELERLHVDNARELDLEQIRQKMAEAIGPDRFKFPRPPRVKA